VSYVTLAASEGFAHSNSTWKFFQTDKFLIKVQSSLLNGMFTNIALRCENTLRWKIAK